MDCPLESLLEVGLGVEDGAGSGQASHHISDRVRVQHPSVNTVDAASAWLWVIYVDGGQSARVSLLVHV